jgi:excisionase family DNA binding protein
MCSDRSQLDRLALSEHHAMEKDLIARRLLTTFEAAERLKLHERTLEVLRYKGQGPAYIKIGRAVRYSEDDLDRFVLQNRTTF